MTKEIIANIKWGGEWREWAHFTLLLTKNIKKAINDGNDDEVH